MKKVLFTATVVKTHINTFHLPYINWFKQQGYTTYVAAKNDFDGEECVIPQCDVYVDIPFERSPFSLKNITAYKKLKKLINENDFDIIHCHTPVGGILTRLAARKARKKGTRVIYTAHGFHFFKGAPIINWILFYPIEKLCSHFTDCLITMNDEDYKLAKKKMKAKKVYYVHGVGVNTDILMNYNDDNISDLKSSLNISKDDFVLLSVGELNKNKNHEVVIKAISKCNNPKLKYVICGEGNIRDQLTALAEQLNVSNQVIMPGYCHQINKMYFLSDAFVMPSFREGLPVAMMEAMACGLPVICSRIRGNTDLIHDGKGGYICGTTDNDEYAKAVEKFMNNHDLCKKMGEYNRSKVRDFSLDNVINEMIEIYTTQK